MIPIKCRCACHISRKAWPTSSKVMPHFRILVTCAEKWTMIILLLDQFIISPDSLSPLIHYLSWFIISPTGAYGEWMSCHPQSLVAAIPLLLQGLENPEVATAATMALKDLTRENLEHIEPFIPQILASCQVGMCWSRCSLIRPYLGPTKNRLYRNFKQDQTTFKFSVLRADLSYNLEVLIAELYCIKLLFITKEHGFTHSVIPETALNVKENIKWTWVLTQGDLGLTNFSLCMWPSILYCGTRSKNKIIRSNIGNFVHTLWDTSYLGFLFSVSIREKTSEGLYLF